MEEMVIDVLVGTIILLVSVVVVLYVRDLKKMEGQQREILRLRQELEKQKLHVG